MTDRASQPWTPDPAWSRADDPRLFAPATLRNRDAILSVLQRILPDTGLVLEIASGSGEHIVHFARAFPALRFQPSDPSPEAVASIGAWTRSEATGNVAQPLLIDASAPSWPIATADALLCINMLHIAPWSATEGLFRNAAALLRPGAPLYLYGPYRETGRELAPGNSAFDASLRSRNPDWGLRDIGDVETVASANGFDGPEIVAMPANNLSVIFRRGPAAEPSLAANSG